MKSIYLAGRIGGFSLAEANEWRLRVINELDGLAKCLNPLRGKKEEFRSLYTDNEIVIRDKGDIQEADIIIAYLPERGLGPSVGTTMEIMYAYMLGKPILMVGDWGKNDIWMRYHCTTIFNNLDDLLDDLKLMWL